VSEILKFDRKLTALTNFSSGVMEWTKLSSAFVIKFVICSPCLITFHKLDF
jgi:hypothetical protein